ncbi:MAG: TIGR04086 family membrane protein [Erysipelotrichaceae bacterium]|nr:TIGR04086 family membrane protein [Erysipelotrichaceae bacterium]
MLKKILNSLLTFFIILIVGTLFLTIFNYFSLLKPSIISILKLIIPIFAIFISSYRLGKQSEKKGYIEGLKLGSLIIIIFLTLVLLLDKFSLKSLIYYLILLLTSILSSMIGINRKKLNT